MANIKGASLKKKKWCSLYAIWDTPFGMISLVSYAELAHISLEMWCSIGVTLWANQDQGDQDMFFRNLRSNGVKK